MQDRKLGQMVAPIAEAMKAYAEDGALAFHTPGHKQGLGVHHLLQDLITAEGLRQEVSLMEELDDLHAPSGCIKRAQDLAAELWGAKETLFMINGTTSAIHAMLLGTLSRNDAVLVPRNAHRSIIGGIILAGATPVYIQPEIEPSLGIAMGLSAQSVQQAMAEHPNAKALLVVYPTYYGYCCDLGEMAELAHKRNMLLLVDEAHGAHLRFSEKLPPQALALGADAVAQSTHKLLGSLTQTSMLHIGSGRVDVSRIKRTAGLLQSTSPNQLLLASLDIARLQMAEEGTERMARAVELARGLRDAMNDIEGLYCAGEELCCRDAGSGAVALDVTKIAVNLDRLNIGGHRAELELRHKYKIQCELSDPRNLLFIISMADTEREVERLLDVLQGFAKNHLGVSRRSAYAENTAQMPEVVQRITPRDAFFARSEPVRLTEAIGRTAAETIAFYPPGVPFICPGEEITQEIVAYAEKYQAMGMRISGVADSSLKTIKVCKGI